MDAAASAGAESLDLIDLVQLRRRAGGNVCNVDHYHAAKYNTVMHWLNVSQQTLINWRARSTGPACRSDRSRRVWYRKSDIDAWLSRRPATPSEASRSFLIEHLPVLQEWEAKGCPGVSKEEARSLSSLVYLIEILFPPDLELVIAAVDRAKLFGPPGPRPRAFVERSNLIGY